MNSEKFAPSIISQKIFLYRSVITYSAFLSTTGWNTLVVKKIDDVKKNYTIFHHNNLSI